MRVNGERMRAGGLGGFMAATDLADYLVGKGVPFRDAHEVVGRLVLACEQQGRTLQDMTAAEYNQHDSRFDADVTDSVDIDEVVSRRVSAGGTGHDAVRAQMKAQADALLADEAWLEAVRG
jgi:argininosuccinate lyase